ncbi:MAG: RNA polymerase sigma factor [Gemmataceae bacterium]
MQHGLELRLSRIETLWTLVRHAHDDAGSVRSAQEKLLERYGGAVRRYLLGAVRDADVADELFQEFACRLVGGNLGGADPARGRFRDFVKGVLFHLVADHHKRKQREPGGLAGNLPEPAVFDAEPDLDSRFLESWREELLARAWAALEAVAEETGQPFFCVLRFRAEHPRLRSEEMAAEIGKQLGRSVSAANVRQLLHRARDRFADLVLEEVLDSLDRPTTEALEQELIDLGLLEYCRPALERR